MERKSPPPSERRPDKSLAAAARSGAPMLGVRLANISHDPYKVLDLKRRPSKLINKVFVVAILAFALCGNASSAADNAPTISADEARAKLAVLVSEADNIYVGAKANIDVSPATEDKVDRLFLTSGKPWSKDEMTFQTSLMQLSKAPQMFPDSPVRYPPEVVEGLIRIGQFDNFIFEAIGDTYECRNAHAHFTLKLSKQLLDHARMASAGHPDPDWDPDDIDGPDDPGKCLPSSRSFEERITPYLKD